MTQDVFERVWRHAPSFDRTRGRLATWLLGMAHHVAIDAVRHRQRRPQAITGEAGALVLKLVPDPQGDVARVTHDNIEGAHVRDALRLLPEAQRRAIELAYFGGLSHPRDCSRTRRSTGYGESPYPAWHGSFAGRSGGYRTRG